MTAWFAENKPTDETSLEGDRRCLAGELIRLMHQSTSVTDSVTK